jgi:fatty acid desaturase
MNHFQPSTRSPSDATRLVRAAIREADARMVEQHPWLGRDDAVAMGFFTTAVLGTGLIAAAWILGSIPTWLAICGIALTVSILHEMEHDLIHDLYLGHPVLRAGVLGTIWLAKSSLDPWTRGHMHRWHHIVSGQEEDIEERLIGLGMPWGPLRALITLFQPISIVLRPRLGRAVRARVAEGGRRPDPRAHSAPMALVLGNAVLFLFPPVALVAWILGAAWAGPALVLWVLPNTLRHTSIVFLSSNSHYVGIQRGDVVQQNQVLDHPLFWPLQFFCWNFGATHVLHHFWVRQPFWRRTLVFREVRPVLLENGVRANDFGSFVRANQY